MRNVISKISYWLRAHHQPLLKRLRTAYLIILAGLVVWVIVSYRSEVGELVSGARPLMLVLCFLSSLVLILLGALFWSRCLHLLGTQAKMGEVVLATARSLPARYIPGSVWFAVGRVSLLRMSNHPLGPLSVTAGLEVILSLGVALASGAAILGAQGILPGGYGWVIALVVVLIAGAAPPLGGRLISWAAAKRGVSLRLTWSGYTQLVSLTLLFWAWSAMTFIFYLRAFPAADQFGLITVAGGFLLTWGLSFLAPFAPQGIGVFELSLPVVLEVESVAGMAVILGGYRLVIGTRDFASASLAELVAARRRNQATQQITATPPG